MSGREVYHDAKIVDVVMHSRESSISSLGAQWLQVHDTRMRHRIEMLMSASQTHISWGFWCLARVARLHDSI